MAGKKFEKGSMEFQFFGDFWQFAQKHYLPNQSDEYWDAVLNDAASLGQKYPDVFCKCLIQGFLEYAEIRSKNGN